MSYRPPRCSGEGWLLSSLARRATTQPGAYQAALREMFRHSRDSRFGELRSCRHLSLCVCSMATHYTRATIRQEAIETVSTSGLRRKWSSRRNSCNRLMQLAQFTAWSTLGFDSWICLDLLAKPLRKTSSGQEPAAVSPAVSTLFWWRCAIQASKRSSRVEKDGLVIRTRSQRSITTCGVFAIPFAGFAALHLIDGLAEWGREYLSDVASEPE